MGMSAIIGALRAVLGVDTDAFEEGLGEAQKMLTKAGRDMQKTGDRIADAGKKMSVAVTLPILGIGAASLRAASDAGEMQSAFNYVFGAMAKDAEAWADRTGKALGRSKYALQEQALSFMQLFKKAAPTQEQAKELSQDFAQLATDLGSFYNVSDSDALDKLRSGLAGEAEPLRKFGVFLTEANVANEAVRMGIAATTKELSEQDKILARASLIWKETSDAQGDAARTADSYSNQEKRALADLKSASIDLGKTLIPVATQLARSVSTIALAFGSLDPEMQKTVAISLAVAAALGPIVFIAGQAWGALGTLLKGISKVGTAAKTAGGLVPLLTRSLAALVASPWTIAIAGIAAALGMVVHMTAGAGQPTGRYADQVDKLRTATDEYRKAASLAAAATGEAKKAAEDDARAKRKQLVQTIATARAKLKEAEATVLATQAEVDRINTMARRPMQAAHADAMPGRWAQASNAASRAAANRDEILSSTKEAEAALNALDGKSGGAPGVDDADPAGAGGKKRTIEEIRLQALLEAARERGDVAAANRLQDRIDLMDRIADYEDAGADKARARAYAEQDLGALQAARAQAADRERQQIAEAVDAEVASLAQNYALEQSLYDQADLRDRIADYQATGLTLADATARATAEQARIDAARTADKARFVDDARATLALQLASMGEDYRLEDSLQRQADLKERIAFYNERIHDLVRATQMAEADMARLDAARAEVRQRWMADDQQDRALRLAQLRGDTDAQVRAIQRVIDIRERARDLEANAGMTREDAFAKALSEAVEQEKARVTGQVRGFFRDGFRAALDNDLKDFAKNWWRERVAKGMEEALNSLADTLTRLFAEAMKAGSDESGTGGGGSGWGSVISSIGKLFKFNPVKDESGARTQPGDAEDMPAFKTGGSFTVGGRAGVDQNLVAFRATKGEMVDIHKKGADRGPPRTNYFDMRGALVTEDLLQQMNQLADGAAVRGAAGGSKLARADQRRQQQRQLPG